MQRRPPLLADNHPHPSVTCRRHSRDSVPDLRRDHVRVFHLRSICPAEHLPWTASHDRSPLSRCARLRPWPALPERTRQPPECRAPAMAGASPSHGSGPTCGMVDTGASANLTMGSGGGAKSLGSRTEPHWRRAKRAPVRSPCRTEPYLARNAGMPRELPAVPQGAGPCRPPVRQSCR